MKKIKVNLFQYILLLSTAGTYFIFTISLLAHCVQKINKIEFATIVFLPSVVTILLKNPIKMIDFMIKNELYNIRDVQTGKTIFNSNNKSHGTRRK